MSPAPIMIGVDVGTTRIKSVVVELDGTEHLAASRSTPWCLDGAHVEADPTVLATTAQTVISEAVALANERFGAVQVTAIGITGMAESGVLLDGRGEPLTPIIAWHDPRAALADVLRELPDFSIRSGMPADPVASIMKLPMLLARADGAARTWLNVPEWIAVSIGGEPFSEVSLASRTGLYEIESGNWWSDAFEFLGVSPELMPSAAGVGTSGSSTATFPPVAGATVVVAGHDHQVAAYAEAAIGSHSLFDSLGTAEAVVRTVAVTPTRAEIALLTEQGTSVGGTVVDGHWALLAGFRSGQILERISRLLGLDRQGRREVSSQALALAGHPTLSVDQDDLSLRIHGITDDVTPAQLWRAAVDAADRDVGLAVAQFDELFGAVNDVAIAGGWLNDPTIQQVKARRFPNFRAARFQEAGAVGAALMAGVAAGVVEPPDVAGPIGQRKPDHQHPSSSYAVGDSTATT